MMRSGRVSRRKRLRSMSTMTLGVSPGTGGGAYSSRIALPFFSRASCSSVRKAWMSAAVMLSGSNYLVIVAPITALIALGVWFLWRRYRKR